MSTLPTSEIQDDLRDRERKIFEENARLHDRTPGEHLKAILFPEEAAPIIRLTSVRKTEKKGVRR